MEKSGARLTAGIVKCSYGRKLPVDMLICTTFLDVADMIWRGYKGL